LHINVVSGCMPYGLYSSPNITWVIKPRRMRWAGHVAIMQKRRGTHRVGGGGGNLRERHHLEDLGINGTITLKQNTEIGWDRVDWNEIAADSNKWQAAVNVVMNFWIPQNAGELLTT